MKTASLYRGFLNYQSEFSRRYACWANNHMGWAKMKKSNKRIAKRREKRIFQKMKKEYEMEVEEID